MSHVTDCQLLSPITPYYLRVLAEIPTSLSLRGLEAQTAFLYLSLFFLPYIPPLGHRLLGSSCSEFSDPLEIWIPILVTLIPLRLMGKTTLSISASNSEQKIIQAHPWKLGLHVQKNHKPLSSLTFWKHEDLTSGKLFLLSFLPLE